MRACNPCASRKRCSSAAVTGPGRPWLGLNADALRGRVWQRVVAKHELPEIERRDKRIGSSLEAARSWLAANLPPNWRAACLQNSVP